jgi:tyrosyl-tRNA synthetase
MQGYDAVSMKTDVQVGGTDQLFNIIVAGRKLQEALGQKPLVGVICGILPGTDGVQRMAKSTGNVIPINTSAADMYGKVMSVPDMAMGKFARLATRWLPAEIEAMEKEVASGKLHPRDAKMRLALEIVSIFYGDSEARAAKKNFVNLFQKKDVPEEMPDYALQPGQTLLDVLVAAGMVTSRADGRRKIEQKGVKLDGQVQEKFDAPFPHPGVLQVGKRLFVRVK